MWLVMHGIKGHDPHPFSVYDKRADAVRDIRADGPGYRYDKETDMFVSKAPDYGDERYYTIELIDHNYL